jgi:hypothetical protein
MASDLKIWLSPGGMVPGEKMADIASSIILEKHQNEKPKIGEG